ncbi:M16 family metallopeptidase [Aquimarina macrocephali]|uniref:M16 family metallopeptidase n=1 Tax=Aquimarina macrocephali TaxID=666563 RepID=UPI0004665DDE|nr:pitrilysin family protein [Aquimarina macrocephali]
MSKKRSKVVFFCSLLFHVVIVLSSYGQTDTLLLNYEQYTLKNGLDVILQPDSNVEDVSVEFWLRKGISMDKPSQYGFAHFFEHMMPFGIMDSLKRAQLKTYRTGSNAQVKKDYTRFYVKVKPKGVGPALEMAAGRLMAGTDRITEKRIEFQRKRVLSEIDRNAKNPQWSAPGGMAIYKGTFGKNHPYGSSGYGLIENNKNFKLKEFKERYNKIVYADNTVLFLVGNFDVEEAKKQIETYFRNLPSKEKDHKIIKPTKHVEANITMKAPHPKNTIQTMVFSWAVPKWGSIDDSTLKLIASILDIRLKDKSRFPESFIKTSVSTDMYEYAGQFAIRTTFAAVKDSTQIENLVLDKVNEFIETGVTEAELKDAKQNEVNDIKEMQQRLGFQWSRTELLGESFLFTGNPGFYVKRLEKQLQLTREDVKKGAKKWLKRKPFRVLFVSDKKE